VAVLVEVIHRLTLLLAVVVALVVTVQALQAKTQAVVHLLRIRCQWLRERLTPWPLAVVVLGRLALAQMAAIQFLAQSPRLAAVRLEVLIHLLPDKLAVQVVVVRAVKMLRQISVALARLRKAQVVAVGYQAEPQRI